MYTEKEIYDGLVFINDKGKGKKYKVTLINIPDRVRLEGIGHHYNNELYDMPSLLRLLNDGSYIEDKPAEPIINNSYSII